MSQPIALYHTVTGETLIMYAPTTAAEMVLSGEYSYQQPAPRTPAPVPGKSLTDFTKAELLAEAKRLGIRTTDSMTKAQLLDLIAAASEP